MLYKKELISIIFLWLQYSIYSLNVELISLSNAHLAEDPFKIL